MISRLDILRHMLSVVGESGVSTENTLHPSVLTATRILDATDKEFQEKGWWFNTEYNLTLVQDNHGEVTVPATALAMWRYGIEDMTSTEKVRYAKRGNKIYDTYLHTTVINTSVAVNLIVQLDIADLPTVAANYIQHQAALTLYEDDDGDTFKSNKLERRVALAWQSLMAAKMKTIQPNALDNPTARLIRAGMHTGSRNPNIIGG